MCTYSVGLRKRSGNISVDLSLFVLLYNTNFMNKLKFNDNKELKAKKNLLTVHFFQSTKSTHFPFRGQVGQLSKEEDIVFLVYLQYIIN